MMYFHRYLRFTMCIYPYLGMVIASFVGIYIPEVFTINLSCVSTSGDHKPRRSMVFQCFCCGFSCGFMVFLWFFLCFSSPAVPSHLRPRSLPSQVRSRHLCGALRVRMRAGLAALSPHQSDGLRYLAVLRRGDGMGW